MWKSTISKKKIKKNERHCKCLMAHTEYTRVFNYFDFPILYETRNMLRQKI